MFAVPVPPPDSTTSGYSVPCTRKRIGSPSAAASSTRAFSATSNDRMNSRPMILRFCSGSETPASARQELLARVDRDQAHTGRGPRSPARPVRARSYAADRGPRRCTPAGRRPPRARSRRRPRSPRRRRVRRSRGRNRPARGCGRPARRSRFRCSSRRGSPAPTCRKFSITRCPKSECFDLGMPLHAIHAPLVAAEGRNGRRRGRGQDLEALRRLRHLISVAHPHVLRGRLAGPAARRRRP